MATLILNIFGIVIIIIILFLLLERSRLPRLRDLKYKNMDHGKKTELRVSSFVHIKF